MLWSDLHPSVGKFHFLCREELMIDTNIQQRKSKSIVNQGQSFFSGGGGGGGGRVD